MIDREMVLKEIKEIIEGNGKYRQYIYTEKRIALVAILNLAESILTKEDFKIAFQSFCYLQKQADHVTGDEYEFARF